MINGENITIYSRYKNGRDERIVRTNLSDCSFFGKTKTSVGDGGLISANQYAIRIPIEQLGGYVLPDTWDGITGWSLSPGDVILKGYFEDAPQSLTEITSKHKDCCTVLAMHDNRRGSLQHLKVEGR